MNQFLTELYGTRETIGAVPDTSDDVEKMAEAEILGRFLDNENVDVESLDGDTILKVAYELFGEGSELVKEAMSEPPEEEEEDEEDDDAEKESADKLAEADFYGRAMAHAYVNELDAMDKEAGRIGYTARQLGGVLESGAKAVKGKGEKMLKTFRKAKDKRPGKDFSTFTTGSKGEKVPGKDFSTFTKGKGNLGALGQVAKEHKKTVGGIGAGLAATGIGAAALSSKKGKKKAASALDILAEQRALEMLKEAGVGVDGARESESLEAAVEKRAWEMLQENGFVEE